MYGSSNNDEKTVEATVFGWVERATYVDRGDDFIVLKLEEGRENV